MPSARPQQSALLTLTTRACTSRTTIHACRTASVPIVWREAGDDHAPDLSALQGDEAGVRVLPASGAAGRVESLLPRVQPVARSRGARVAARVWTLCVRERARAGLSVLPALPGARAPRDALAPVEGWGARPAPRLAPDRAHQPRETNRERDERDDEREAVRRQKNQDKAQKNSPSPIQLSRVT